jgi:hypothetical protein
MLRCYFIDVKLLGMAIILDSEERSEEYRILLDGLKGSFVKAGDMVQQLNNQGIESKRQ